MLKRMPFLRRSGLNQLSSIYTIKNPFKEETDVIVSSAQSRIHQILFNKIIIDLHFIF